MAKDKKIGELVFLHLSGTGATEEAEMTLADGTKAKVIWKDILVEGTYPMTPTAQGAIEKEMHVIENGDSDAAKGVIAMSDLVESHKNNAFKYVTIPTKHRDDLLDNTGYVPKPDGLRIVKREDKTILQAALGFTEPDIAGKVRRGTIPDVSAGILFKWLNKHTKKRFPAALKHVALTPVPFMGNLEPFPAVFASDDLNEDGITADMESTHYFLDETDGEDGSEDPPAKNANAGDIVWNEVESFNWMRDELDARLNPSRDEATPASGPVANYWVKDVATDKALCQERYKGNVTNFIIPFKVVDGELEVSPSIRWVEAKEAMIAASDDEEKELDVEAEGIPFSRSIIEKLDVELSELGEVGKTYRVQDVALDNNAKIKNISDGSVHLAEFGVFGSGDVFLAPPAEWKQIVAPKANKRPASIGLSETNVFDESTPEGRVAAARKRRQIAGAK